MGWQTVLGGASNLLSGGGGDSLGSLVKLLGDLHGQSQANKIVRQGNVATAAETQQNALYQALLDPNNPMTQQLSAQDRANNLANFQRQISEMQLADRRSVNAGRVPTFFNPERADEAVSYLTSRGLPQMDALAQQQAQARILQAAQGIGGLQGAQQGRQNLAMAQGLSNSAQQQTLPTQILDILRSIGGPQQTPMGKPAAPAPAPTQMSGYNLYGQYAPPKNTYNLTSNQMRYPS